MASGTGEGGAAKHTPLPWMRGEFLLGSPGLWPEGNDDSPIARFHHGDDVGRSRAEAVANMKFVHRAVACHAELLAACEEALAGIEPINKQFYRDSEWPFVTSLKMAIASAKGEAR